MSNARDTHNILTFSSEASDHKRESNNLGRDQIKSKARMENTSHCIGVATYYLPTDIKFHMPLLLLAGGKEQCPMREILTIFSHFVRKRVTKREPTVLDATKINRKQEWKILHIA
jgi:hypothetical protein